MGKNSVVMSKSGYFLEIQFETRSIYRKFLMGFSESKKNVLICFNISKNDFY
jgi:hypothetical protein